MTGSKNKENEISFCEEENDEIKQVLNEIQECSYKKYKEHFATAYKIIKNDINVLILLFEQMLNCKKRCLPNKITKFIKEIMEKMYKERKISKLKKLIRWLSDFTLSKSINCRKHSLSIIRIIINTQTINQNEMHEFFTKNEIVEELIEEHNLVKIAERMLDKEASVRKEAIKICLRYQTKSLADNFTVVKILKHVLQHDTNKDLRKLVMVSIKITLETTDVLLERCMDVNKDVRYTFWTKIFNQLNILEFEKTKRVFLMQKAVQENCFKEAKLEFCGFLKNNVGLYDFIAYFSDEGDDFEKVLIEMYLEQEEIESFKLLKDQFLIEKITNEQWFVFVLIYYRHIENTKGRDFLQLDDINILSELIFTAIENEKIKELKYLLDILHFYDIFEQEKKNAVLKILKSVILKQKNKELLEEMVVLIKKISFGPEMEKYLGVFIHKLKDEEEMTLIFCKNVLKHIDGLSNEFTEAIYAEKICPLFEDTQNTDVLMCLYFYMSKKSNIEEELKDILLTFDESTEFYNVLTDLVIENKIQFVQVQNYYTFEDEDIEKSIFGLLKLLIFNKIEDTETKIAYLRNILLIYYNNKISEECQQKILAFVFEYFKQNIYEIVLIFNGVLDKLEKNHNIFIDQIIRWVQISGQVHVFEELLQITVNNMNVTTKTKVLDAYITFVDNVKAKQTYSKHLLEQALDIFSYLINEDRRVEGIIENFTEQLKNAQEE